jgi:hypothetical protein
MNRNWNQGEARLLPWVKAFREWIGALNFFYTVFYPLFSVPAGLRQTWGIAGRIEKRPDWLQSILYLLV